MDDVTVRYFGWSAISIETADGRLFFDPFFRKYCGAQWFSLPDFQHADFIVATHGHEEHFLDIPDLAKATGAVVIGPPAAVRFLMSRRKLSPKQLLEISPWESIKLKGFDITAFPWQHRDINLWKALTKAVFLFNTTQLKWAFSSAVSAPFYAPFTGYHVCLPNGLTIMNYNEGFNTKMTTKS
jgi:L-ascorbate metabolism protein UlaG (beta-lactamase superfamily)